MIIQEAAIPTQVTGRYDVVVAGAGPAGVVAAISAARQGVRVLLIEPTGCLGGVWTSGLLCWVIDAHGKGGIMAEIGEKLDAMGAQCYRPGLNTNYAYDPEAMKYLLDTLCEEAGVEVLLYSRVVACHKEGNRLTHVITESPSGREAWGTHVAIDCTGNGDLAARAGCGFDVGHPETGAVQPSSLPSIVTGLNPDAISMFRGGSIHAPKERFLEAIRAAGVEPSYVPPVMMQIHDDLYVMIVDHQYGVDSSDARSLTKATMNARREVQDLCNALKASGGPWCQLRLVATAAQLGIREGRRIHGRDTIGMDHVRDGFHSSDSVTTCAFGFDVHSTNPQKSTGFEKVKVNAQPFGISLGSLVARDIDGLMMAGRCISGDFFAHSAYRVTGTAAAMGQAAGICSALAVQSEQMPHEVPANSVIQQLKMDGVNFK